jgi:hypothetical protein
MQPDDHRAAQRLPRLGGIDRGLAGVELADLLAVGSVEGGVEDAARIILRTGDLVSAGARLRRDRRKGGAGADIARKLDSHFTKLGWIEKAFDTRIAVDKSEFAAPTHKVDCYKNRVALEVEWNNKDPFFDRDLNNFRLLFDLRAIDAGVIITRCSELQLIFNQLGRGPSFGNSTTHMAKLLPRLDGGSGGGCPVVVFGIRGTCYVED